MRIPNYDRLIEHPQTYYLEDLEHMQLEPNVSYVDEESTSEDELEELTSEDESIDKQQTSEQQKTKPNKWSSPINKSHNNKFQHIQQTSKSDEESTCDDEKLKQQKTKQQKSKPHIHQTPKQKKLKLDKCFTPDEIKKLNTMNIPAPSKITKKNRGKLMKQVNDLLDKANKMKGAYSKAKTQRL